MLFQDAPPDTSAYMIAGYAIFFAISIIYVISLVVRRRNLEKDLQMLEAMEAEARSAPGSGQRKPGARKPKPTK
jgi:hypothetical protein